MRYSGANNEYANLAVIVPAIEREIKSLLDDNQARIGKSGIRDDEIGLLKEYTKRMAKMLDDANERIEQLEAAQALQKEDRSSPSFGR